MKVLFMHYLNLHSCINNFSWQVALKNISNLHVVLGMKIYEQTDNLNLRSLTLKCLLFMKMMLCKLLKNYLNIFLKIYLVLS